jgi:hypothetical protein
VKLTFDAQVGKRQSISAFVLLQYTEGQLYRRASWKHGHKLARKKTQGRKLATQRASTLVKPVCRRVLSNLCSKFGPENCNISKPSLQFEVLTGGVMRRADWQRDKHPRPENSDQVLHLSW